MMIPRVLKRSRPYSSSNTKLLDLPRDILVDIVLRQPLKSVSSIRCASKRLNNIVDKNFIAQYTRRLHNALPTGEVPQLMLLARSHEGIKTVTKTFHPLQYHGGNALNMKEHGNGSEIIVSQECTYEVHCVFGNLICFKDVSYGGPSFLLNPLMGEVLRLPASKVPIPSSIRCRRELFDWLVMGFDDTTGTHKILRVCGNSQYKNLVAQVLVLGTDSWREIRAVPPCNLSHKNASACGDMHWMVDKQSRTRGREESNIISFDFKKEEFYWTSHPKLRSEYFSDLKLVNLKGCLAIVDAWLHSHSVFMEIWVLKNYEVKEWVREYCTEIKFGFPYFMGSYGEWEHGIFFKDAISRGFQNRASAMFLDLRGSSVQVELVKCPITLMQNWTIISYTGSLVSLKHYGNLIEAEACDEYRKQLGFSEKLWLID
ncbi:F-box protein [Rosa sericea]